MEINHSRTQQIIVKEDDKSAVDQRAYSDEMHAMKEFAFLQLLGDNHPHVSGQICCLVDENQNLYYSVMKFRGYDLSDYIFSSSQCFSEDFCRNLFNQLVCGMEYLQSFGICHRDLSIENLTYDPETDSLSIIDYGMALLLPRDPLTGDVQLIPPSGSLGKSHYMPPEILANRDPLNGFLSDHWNLGIILFLS